MALPRGRQQPERFGPSSAAPEAANNNSELNDSEFQKNILNDFPHFTNHREDVRLLSAVCKKFNLNNYKNLNVFVLAYDKENRDVSAGKAFGENEVVFFTKNKGRLKALEARGHEAEKRDLTRGKAGEQADVIVMLDSSITITKKLLENAAPGAFMIIRGAKAANTLRAHGTYTFKGIVESGSGNAHVSKHEDPNFWKNAEVDSEESFKEASDKAEEGIVTYEEAREKVLEAKKAGVSGMHEERVFESYSRLTKMAEEQNTGAFAEGETKLMITLATKEGGVETSTELKINIALPVKKGLYEDTVFVMRKAHTS